jgi:hypothetical protein
MIPDTAIARRLATLETALLIPEAVPVRSWLTEFMTVVVSGATITASPKPRKRTPGRTVPQ